MGYERSAVKAGTWYTGNRTKLSKELEEWNRAALADTPSPAQGKRVAAAICPHAGYAYSGLALAHALCHVKRGDLPRTVLVLGPSHRLRLEGCALYPECTSVETPLGSIPVDRERVERFQSTGLFREVGRAEDEAEHSLEMMYPMLLHALGPGFSVVPVLVGSLRNQDYRDGVAALIREMLDDPTCLVCVSSDFCHWGERFDFTPYDASRGEIHESIKGMDADGMRAIATLDAKSFTDYLGKTRNTICGRNPITLLLDAVGHAGAKGAEHAVRWVKYYQSSACMSMGDSSVSYAAGLLERSD